MSQQEEGLISQEMLKKYLIYAKRFMQPKLTEIDQDKLTQFYADIRRESSVVGGIPIAVRHIESVIRMSEAHAKLHLRTNVRSDDIDFAIEMLLESFLQSQKVSVSRQLSKKFEKYKTRQTDSTQLLLHTLKIAAKNQAVYDRALNGLDETEKVQVKVKMDFFENEAREFARHNLMDFYKSAAFLREFKIDKDHICSINKI
jgi:DNA replication licensing factor MCM2